MLFRLSLLTWVLCGVSLVSSQTPYPITGVKVEGNNGVPLRMNINDLQAAGGPQWDLYIRSLIRMYKQDSTDTLSFFQIAGIHGKPYVEWDAAGGRQAGNNDWWGYCPHGEDLFLPWHRPYLVLYEQRLVEWATRLAKGYPSRVRSQYINAAKTLRAPYWDWAASPTVPAATVPKTVRITIPDGDKLKKIDIDNPLATYKFPKAALDGKFGTFDQPRNRPQITRCNSPKSYPSSANQLIAQQPFKQWVYDAFTYSTTFKQFASTASSGVSLEQIHNAIHWDGACGGQFLDADFSAFDPLFMLHHANVDRLWAYWQFIRPSEALFQGSYSGGSRYSTRQGTTITIDSPLHPFFAAPGRLHTPKSVKSIKSFGYTYQGLEYWRKSDAQLKKDATALINQLYGTGASGPNRIKRDDGNTTRYFIQVKVDVEDLDRPAIVNLYLDNTNAGSLVVMKQPQTGIVNGEFAIDEAAQPITAQEDTTKGVVETVLDRLRVEIEKPDGTIIPVDTVPSLKLSLVNVDVVPPAAEDKLPEYGEPEKRPAPKEEKEPPASS
ncbi:Fc.00g105800.m01.CDS01 [Cosmosporella sp. VM-42]